VLEHVRLIESVITLHSIYSGKQREEKPLVGHWHKCEDDIESNPKEIKIWDNVTLG
jgi:hypothetical protein